MLGALVWQKAGKVRISLDRADLWDLRPMKGLDRPEFRWDWVRGQVAKKDYGIVQQYGYDGLVIATGARAKELHVLPQHRPRLRHRR